MFVFCFFFCHFSNSDTLPGDKLSGRKRPIIPALDRKRQRDAKSHASLGYIEDTGEAALQKVLPAETKHLHAESLAW